MKIFRLTFIVRNKFSEYDRHEWFVFPDDKSAARYGIKKEIEENTGKLPQHDFSEDERQNARMHSTKEKLRHVHFLFAEEIEFVQDENDKFYDVFIRQRIE